MNVMLIISLFSSIVCTFIVKQIVLKKNIINNPNERSSHKIPTPRGVGFAIAIVWFLVISYIFFFRNIDQNISLALMSGAILVIIGFIDDIYSLNPGIRIFLGLLCNLINLT